MDNLPSLIQEAKEALYSCSKKNIYSEGKACKGCGNPIANWNESGHCKKCRRNPRHINRKQYQAAYKSVRAENKKKRRVGKKGKCRLCGRRFQLESWQHSTLHWCPRCRKGEAYQEYSSNEFRGYRYGIS